MREARKHPLALTAAAFLVAAGAVVAIAAAYGFDAFAAARQIRSGRGLRLRCLRQCWRPRHMPSAIAPWPLSEAVPSCG